MSEELFRIVVTIAVVLACIAFLVLAGAAVGLLSVVRKIQAKLEPLMTQAQPVIAKVGPVVDQVGVTISKAGPILETTNKILEDTRPRVAEVADQTVAISKSVRQQVDHAGVLLQDAGDRARNRLHQIDETVEATVDQVGEVGGSVKRALAVPVREVNGIAAGISAAVSTLAKGRKSSVDAATQDEEMFI